MYTIREISSQFRISRRMIQEYKNHELIKADARNKYGHLLYEEKTVKTMKEIRFLQDIGLSLKEIKIFKESDNDNRRKLLFDIEPGLRKR